MTEKATCLLKAFIELTETERLNVYEEIKAYQGTIDLIKKMDLKEKIEKEFNWLKKSAPDCPFCKK